MNFRNKAGLTLRTLGFEINPIDTSVSRPNSYVRASIWSGCILQISKMGRIAYRAVYIKFRQQRDIFYFPFKVISRTFQICSSQIPINSIWNHFQFHKRFFPAASQILFFRSQFRASIQHKFLPRFNSICY